MNTDNNKDTQFKGTIPVSKAKTALPSTLINECE